MLAGGQTASPEGAVPTSGPDDDDEPPERPVKTDDPAVDDRTESALGATEAHLQELWRLFRDLTRRFNN
jgi:hypothetical protein